jgi:V/A-type H+/Na+-transporting ATPase subunit D
MPDSTPSPTRSAFLELKDESQLVREGFEFLDEKRVILAQEMLKRVKHWRETQQRFDELHDQAGAALVQALGRHGLDGLGIYPITLMENAGFELRENRFLGVNLIDGEFHDGRDEKRSHPPAVNPSPEAERCRKIHEELLQLSMEMAIMRSSLERLVREYIRTERRARALENVVLPEIEETLRFIEEQLEAMDQEEAIRVRNAGK